MIKHPYIFCRLETKERLYTVDDYQIHLERQRPILGSLTIKEPIERDNIGVLQLGFQKNVYRTTALRVVSCAQIAEKTFDVLALEPLREILDLEYIEQLQGVDLISALRTITKKLNLTFKVLGIPPVTKPKNLIFLETIRNAFDQLWQIFEQTDARWFINLMTQEFIFLPEGKFPIPAVKIPMDYFKSEFDGGIEINIVPMFRPFTPVTWRDQEEIIDIARIDSKTRSMSITFAEKTE